MEDRSYKLILAYFDKTISDEELNDLQEWLELHPDHQDEFRETLQILEATKLYVREPENASLSWNKISAHVQQQPVLKTKTVHKRAWLAYAASVMLITALGYWGYAAFQRPEQAVVKFSEISNPAGRHSKILLPDSSVVHLAGGSKIRYAEDFKGKTRTVYLTGEAFFNVIHRKRPFIIKNGEISTVVLGTSFNVKAFDRDHKVTVTVNTGKVGVLNRIKGKNVLVRYLLPNEELELNTITGQTRFSKVSANEVSAWINNHFIFNDASLFEVISALERRYGSDIQLMDKEAGNIHLTATFRNMPLKLVLDELMLLTDLSYKEKDKQIFIYQPGKTEGQTMK